MKWQALKKRGWTFYLWKSTVYERGHADFQGVAISPKGKFSRVVAVYVGQPPEVIVGGLEEAVSLDPNSIGMSYRLEDALELATIRHG